MTTCPLCSSPPTQFAHPLSDSCDLPFEDQQCSNHACELPCALWERVSDAVTDQRRWRWAVADFTRASSPHMDGTFEYYFHGRLWGRFKSIEEAIDKYAESSAETKEEFDTAKVAEREQ